ncbi:hypothetical protein R5R35_005770 [Gryllus longicercus]|uniref:Protein LSM14 homolog B n=1 Tax=Gryllus longicercus TaxID=2509291 RepID=A0AAN9ZFU6_9ORTH
MSTGMPELGSKISLISKADIRYEGRLFTLDPQECTIALANVRSFGTEDRETQYRVAPQNEVYDYILFRGSDIKDIRVVNNVGPLPNDPAIVQLSVPPSGLASSAYPTQGFSHPVLGHMGPGLTQYPAYGGMGAMTGLPSAVAPGMSLHRDPHSLPKQSELVMPVQVPDHQTNKDQDFITGSRSATPSLIVRKSPTMDQGVQVNQIGMAPVKDTKKLQQVPPPAQQGRAVRSSDMSRDGGLPSGIGQQQQQQYHPQPQRQPRERERDRDHARELADHGPVSRPPHQVQHPSQKQQPQQQQQQQQQPRGGWGNRARRARPRGSTGNFNRQQGGGPQQGNQSNKPKNTLKFENDYDFEQANTEFEELRNQLSKAKIADTEPVIAGDGKVNGDSEKKDDSGNETCAGENEHEEEHEVFYDKSKSFFDNISCEAVERSKGRSQRTDWRTERKLNSETFGVASARRGGYRGRGFYGNRGNMFRGGKFRGNFRGQGGGRGGGGSGTGGGGGGGSGGGSGRPNNPGNAPVAPVVPVAAVVAVAPGGSSGAPGASTVSNAQARPAVVTAAPAAAVQSK